MVTAVWRVIVIFALHFACKISLHWESYPITWGMKSEDPFSLAVLVVVQLKWLRTSVIAHFIVPFMLNPKGNSMSHAWCFGRFWRFNQNCFCSTEPWEMRHLQVCNYTDIRNKMYCNKCYKLKIRAYFLKKKFFPKCIHSPCFAFT